MSHEPSKCEQAIVLAVKDTLENMVFMEAFPVTDGSQLPDEPPCLVAHLLIHDPLQGELHLIMPRLLAEKISQTIYGLPEEELTEQIINDTFAEVINVIAGRFMNEFLPKQQLYRLGLPELHPADVKDPELPHKEWLLTADGMKFLVRIVGKAFF